MVKKKFEGPLFIIGFPRSGKKLLRDLLNQNPRIGIPIHETGFIPRFVNRYGNPPKFDDPCVLQSFYLDFIQDPYFHIFKKEGMVLSKECLEKVADKTSWHMILESVFRFYAPSGRDDGFIWGDKSPHYLNYMPLIKRILPKAKFIHCIRDPRDVCVSYQQAWGKSIYRAAETWRQRMEAALIDSLELGEDYLKVFYESLLRDPKETLVMMCKFLDCDFSPSMMELTRAPEVLGDTGGQVRIVRENLNIFTTHLSQYQIKRIEEIVHPIAKTLGYELQNDVRFKPLDAKLFKILTVHDACASFKFHVHQYGIRQGFHRLLHWHTQDNWINYRLLSSRNRPRISR